MLNNQFKCPECFYKSKSGKREGIVCIMDSKQILLIIKKINKFLFRKKVKQAEYNEQLVKNISRKGIKDCFTGDDTLTFSGKQQLIVEDINKQARLLIKNAIEQPELLIDFVSSKGTLIVKSRHMDKTLRLFGQKPGFIPPMSGIKALFFILIINMFSQVKLDIGLKTPALFALKDEPLNIYTLSHQFHLWLSYINDLPGFEEKTIKNFRNFWDDGADSRDISYLSVDDMLSLKDIIARELEALNFVKEMARELVGQKTSLEKLRAGKSISL